MVPELFSQNVPESRYIINMGSTLPIFPDVQKISGTLLPKDFNLILSAKPVWPNRTTET